MPLALLISLEIDLLTLLLLIVLQRIASAAELAQFTDHAAQLAAPK